MNHQTASFRANPRVFQILAISLVALALPLTLVGLGLRIFLKKPDAAVVSEAPGLRTVLEQAAEKNFPAPPEISDARSLYIQPHADADPQKQIKVLVELAARLGGVALQLPREENGVNRILIQMPAEKAGAFESSGLQGFTVSRKGHPTGDTQIYEIQFPGS